MSCINRVLSIVIVIHFCEALKVKINNNEIVEVGQRVNGFHMKQYGAVTLDFEEHKDWKETIIKIENFDDVTRVSLDGNVLNVIPALEDMPQMRELSLNYNRISAVHTAQFSMTVLSKISLAYNSIGSIYVGAFHNDLEDLNLRCNVLTEILAKWFTRPENLKTLDVSNNKISSIKSASFRSFSQLIKLNLSGNKIKQIQPGSFTFQTMHKLDLSLNKISDLNTNIFFQNSVELQSLNITYNKLNFLSESFLYKVFGNDQTREISTFGNPWQCKCLKKFENLVKQYKVAQNEPPESHGGAKCIVSLTYPSQCAELVEEELAETFEKYVSSPKPYCPK